MKCKKSFVVSIILLVLFVLFTALVKFEDVNFVGETNKEIGLASINKKYSYLEYNKTYNLISGIPLFLSVAVMGIIVVGGFVQAVKRKSLFKIDKGVVAFEIFIVILGVIWYLFDEILIINYRPILVNGQVEASYPSTHILLVTFALLSTPSVLYDYYKNRKVVIALSLLSAILISITFVLRLASGMHWFTDCVGGAMLGLAMYCLYIVCKQIKVKKEEL